MYESEVRALDLRLIPPALACWAATLLGILAGWQAATIAAGVMVVAAIVLGVVAGRRVRMQSLCAGALAMLVLGSGFGVAIAWRAHAVEQHPLTAAAHTQSWVTLTVAPDNDPKRIRPAVPGGADQVLIRAQLRTLRTPTKTVDLGGTVIVFAPTDGWQQLLPGQEITLRGQLSAPRRQDLTVAVVSVDGPPLQVGAPPVLQRWAGAVRARFAEAVSAALPPDQAGLLPGLVVGDTSALSPEVEGNFEVAGLTHLTAVSGANISIVLGAVLLLVRFVGIGPRTAVLVSGIVLIAFVIVARPSPSVLRAAMMGSIGLLALVAGRRKQALPALGTAVIVLLAWAPALAVNPGFALSVTATAGLIVLAPVWVDRLCARRWPRTAAEVFAVAASAFVVTAPLVAGVSGTASPVAILANVLVAPVIPLITVVGAIGAVLSTVSLPVAEVFVRIAYIPLWWLLRVAEWAAGIPGASITVPSGVPGAILVGAVLTAAVFVVFCRRARLMVFAAVIGVAAVWFPLRFTQPGWPAPGWALVACDVGQGDALVLDTGDGRAVVVDAGPDPQLVDACLKRLDVTVIALVILTHLHADHIGGLAGVLRGRSVAALALGPMLLPHSGFELVSETTAEAGTRMVHVQAGTRLVVGTLRMDVLGPVLPVPRDPDQAAEAANDQSVVIMAHTAAGRALLTGDMEAAAQESLLRSGVDLSADILKLPHHGSRNMSADFLATIRPRVVLVCVGSGNTYGHPAPAILAELDQLGAITKRTDLDGDIAVASQSTGRDSGALSVSSVPRGTILR